MADLILAIVSSALVSLMMRRSERHGKDRVTMLAVNYVVCTALAACFVGVPSGDGMGMAAGLGAVSGVLYLGSFVLLQRCISHSGVILPAAFMKLGVLVPTVLAVTVLGERAEWYQLAGAALAGAAIAVMNLRGRERVRGLGGLVLLMLAGGMTDGMSKVFEVYGNAAWKGFFLLVTFACALALCVLLAIRRGGRPVRADLTDGLLIGVPNFFSAHFLLRSLASVPAVVAFPTYSVATIAVVTLAGVAAFGERPSRRQYLALGMIGLALALLNIS